jgi:hypothetical protein
VPKPGQAYEPEVPIEVREWIGSAPAYAVMYPERAALIRRLGRVPDDVTFDRPDDDLVQELLATQDPVVTFIDERFAQDQE